MKRQRLLIDLEIYPQSHQVVAMFRTEEIVSIDSVPAIAEIKVRHGEEK